MTQKFWTESEDEIMRSLYPDNSTVHVAEKLGKTLSGVYQRARKLGLLKSAAYLDSPAACRLRRGDNPGIAYRYKKGQVPPNKGLRRPGWAPGRMAESQFKKGNRPHDWRPIGSTRLSKDGYLERKVSDTGYSPRDWKGVHVTTWETINGPVPTGHAVVFKDGNKEHIDIDNLELISRADLMRRNTIHRLPPELKSAIMQAGVLKRRIREHEEAHGEK